MDLSRLLSHDQEDGSRGDGAGTPPRPPAVSAPLFFLPSVSLPPVASPPHTSPTPLSSPQGSHSPPRASVPRPLPAAFGLDAMAGGRGPPLGGDRSLGTPSPRLSDGDRRPLGMAVTPPGTAGVLAEHKTSFPSFRQLGIGSKPHSAPSRTGSVWTPPTARPADAAAAAGAAYVPVAYTSPHAIRAAAACRRMAATAATVTRGAPSPTWPPPQGGGALAPPLDGGRVRFLPTGSAGEPHVRHPPVPVRATVTAEGGTRQGASLPGFASLASTLGVVGGCVHVADAPADFAAARGVGARGAAAADSATVWPRHTPYDRGNTEGGGSLVGAAQPPAAASVPGWGWDAPHGAVAAVDWRYGGGGAAAAHGRLSSWSDETLARSHRGWVAAPLRGSRSADDLPDRPWMAGAIGKRRGEAGHVPHLWGGGGRGSGARARGASARPFGCADCGRRFSQKGSLHRHIDAVHLRLRPHECSKCGKGAFWSALSFGGGCGGATAARRGGGVVRLLSAASARACVGPVVRVRRRRTDVPVDAFWWCLLCVVCAVMRAYGWL